MAIPLALTACGGPTDRLVMDEFAYSPDEIVVPADTEHTVQIVNDGDEPHDITVEGLPDDVRVHLAVLPGGEAPYRLPALPAGRYPVHCSLPGHREAGMTATLVVEP